MTITARDTHEAEFNERGKSAILTQEQYVYLRMTGKSDSDISAFEVELAEEVSGRNDRFLQETYIELRVQGQSADSISYDECHMIR